LGEQGTLISLLLEEATALDWRNDFPGSAARVASAERLAAQCELNETQRAALAVGSGRALFRQGAWEKAASELERAARLAELSGDAGYETLVIALLLLQVVLPQLGRVADGERVSEQVMALSRSRGDQLHLASAINNRRNLLVARKALADCIADQLAFMRIGRELGMVVSEYLGEINLGEMLFQSGDEEAASRHIERAVSIEERHPEVAPRPFAALLKARALAAQGKGAEARVELARIREAVARAESEGKPAGALAANEAVLVDLVELATRPAETGALAAPEQSGSQVAASPEWDALVQRSTLCSMEQEHLEVLELRARAALHAGRIAEADQTLAAARAAAERIPNLFDARLSRLGELIESARAAQ
jgi:tetratricopeptide (TPR) repeat protein